MTFPEGSQSPQLDRQTYWAQDAENRRLMDDIVGEWNQQVATRCAQELDVLRSTLSHALDERTTGIHKLGRIEAGFWLWVDLSTLIDLTRREGAVHPDLLESTLNQLPDRPGITLKDCIRSYGTFLIKMQEATDVLPVLRDHYLFLMMGEVTNGEPEMSKRE